MFRLSIEVCPVFALAMAAGAPAAPVSIKTDSVAVTVRSPARSPAFGVKFGVPLGSVSEAQRVAVYRQGERVPADVFPMGDWRRQPSRWCLIALPVPPEWGGKAVDLEIRRDGGGKPREKVKLASNGQTVTLDNGVYTVRLGPAGIEEIGCDGKVFQPRQWAPSLRLTGGDAAVRVADGVVTVQWDGKLYKRIRWQGEAGGFRIQQEFDIFAGSPVLRSRVRFWCVEVCDIDAVLPVDAVLDGAQPRHLGGPEGRAVQCPAGGRIRQRKADWSIDVGETRDAQEGSVDNLGEWVAFTDRSGLDVVVVARGFQEEGPVKDDMESVLEITPVGLKLAHWRGAPTEFQKDVARGFDVDIVLGRAVSQPELVDGVKHGPYAVYDRDCMTSQGVLT